MPRTTRSTQKPTTKKRSKKATPKKPASSAGSGLPSMLPTRLPQMDVGPIRRIGSYTVMMDEIDPGQQPGGIDDYYVGDDLDDEGW